MLRFFNNKGGMLAITLNHEFGWKWHRHLVFKTHLIWCNNQIDNGRLEVRIMHYHTVEIRLAFEIVGNNYKLIKWKSQKINFNVPLPPIYRCHVSGDCAPVRVFQPLSWVSRAPPVCKSKITRVDLNKQVEQHFFILMKLQKLNCIPFELCLHVLFQFASTNQDKIY